MTRLQEIRAELATIAKEQEKRAVLSVRQALNDLNEVASSDFAGRQAVRNEAERLSHILARESWALSAIVERASS